MALSGVILTPDGPVAGEVVFDQSTGLITCGPDDSCEEEDVSRICTEGVISPGLIDSHNHMQYNALKPWEHGDLFEDRYDWRSDGAYWDYRTAYDAVDGPYGCEIMKWAELRSLVAGTTAVVGSSGGACINPLIRNLDEGAGASGIPGYNLYYSASTVTDRFEVGDTIVPGSSFDAVENHVAEGVNGSGTHELAHMMRIGMEGPGQIYVHATDATTAQLARMADQGTTIAWSPRSNLDLYAATTPADVAHTLGVPLTLAPDWTWSGSTSPARELTCAADYLRARDSRISDVTMWSWTTSEAARALNLDGVLGGLEAGMRADISVFDYGAEPYRVVIDAAATSTRLVLRDGLALYGEPEWVSMLAENPAWCESIDACGEERSVCAKAGSSGDDSQTAADIEEILSSALGAVSMPAGLDYANDLLGLFSCEETRASCDISSPSEGDTDGDGVPDADDTCPSAYDPLQRDHDGDGAGDVCDPCPLASDVVDCTHTPGDIDGDGADTESDNCPWLANEDQADMDEDGKGDGCDPCPEEYNPGDLGCTYSLSDIRDPSSALHPGEGADVRVAGMIVTGVRDGSGFYIQDPEATSYGGIYVYDAGDFSSGAVAIGDEVTVSGVYSEYYGLSQIGDPEVTVTDTGRTIEPIVIASTCDIGTGGVLAEPLEGMVVTVNDVTVTDSNPDAPADYGELELDECLRVDDQLSEVLVPQPPEGTTYSALSGVLTYTYSHAKIVPRGSEDVVE